MFFIVGIIVFCLIFQRTACWSHLVTSAEEYNRIQSINILVQITPDGEASFDYNFALIDPILTDIVIPMHSWRYELSSLFGLVTPSLDILLKWIQLIFK